MRNNVWNCNITLLQMVYAKYYGLQFSSAKWKKNKTQSNHIPQQSLIINYKQNKLCGFVEVIPGYRFKAILYKMPWKPKEGGGGGI